MRGLFITATGTDVGKTLVTAGVLRQLRANGIDAMPLKPVQTGAIAVDKGLRAPDINYVLKAAGLDPELGANLAPYLYEPACSPHLAARMAGKPISIQHICQCARALSAKHEFLLIEGAGGLMVPLNDEELMIDLAAALGLPVLLVGSAGLGSINHVLLSLEALRKRNLNIAGVVLNEAKPVAEADRFICDDNRNAIATFGQVKVLANIPWLGDQPDFSLLDKALAEARPLLTKLTNGKT